MEGLLDEILLGIAPVMLGGGTPLLPRRVLAPELTLATVATNSPQFVFLTYHLARREADRRAMPRPFGPPFGRSRCDGDAMHPSPAPRSGVAAVRARGTHRMRHERTSALTQVRYLPELARRRLAE